MSAMILGLLIGLNTLAQYRCVLGTDLTAVLKTGGVNVSVRGRIGARWSASWRTELSLDSIRSDEDMEYVEHHGEFTVGYHREPVPHSSRAGLEYWPAGTFRGTYLGAGMKSTQDTEADCYMDIGYCIPVGKGLCAILSYGTDILATLRNGKPSGTGLGLGIYWAIGKHS